VNIVDHVDEAAILVVALDAWVVDVGDGAEVVDLGFAVLVSDETALLLSEGQELALFLS
jgi:hypothetical protein